MSESGKLAHYRCAKTRKWKRKTRAKKKIQAEVREIAPPKIRVVRGGEVIKELTPPYG